jgi:protein-disulfide isomerase
MAMPRLTANRVLVLVLVVAAGLAAALIAVSMTGAGDDAAPASVYGAADTQALLAGIPQHGNVLGKPDAPVAIVEFADLQCPYCAQWALDTFPALVNEYVRSGRVKIVFDGIAILGPDSLTALQTAFSAGLQNKLWNVVDLMYENQGDENAGWVTDERLKSIGSAVAGLEVNRMMDNRDSAGVAAGLADAQGAAQGAGVANGPTPTFEIGRTGGSMTQLQGARSAAEFREILNGLLKQ